jgi:hypothetical protein
MAGMTTARRTLLALAVVLVAGGLTALAVRAGSARAVSSTPTYSWGRFNVTSARSGAEAAATGITAANVGSLHRTTVHLPGTADSSPIYLHGVTVGGATRNVFFLTTTYGRTVAVSATGTILWTYTPASYADYAGTYQITTATPAADPTHRFVFAATPNGLIHKLSVASGHEIKAGPWPVRVTTLPAREKIASALNTYRSRLYVTTGGYIGDQPPYQGHVVIISMTTGKKLGVWNSLCSHTHHLLRPSRCPESDSAIFGRSGAVIDTSAGTARGNILVATGNGRWNGRQYWGDSVLELSPKGGHLAHTFTPTDQAQLDQTDTDVGSTSPAIVRKRGPVVVQGGKDGKLRVIPMGRQGVGHLGGSVQTLSTPGGAELFSSPAVWKHGKTTWVFVADTSGTDAYRVAGAGRHTRLKHAWGNGTAGTSPIVAGGLLYIYDPGGALDVYAPGSGHRLANLTLGAGHWNSPIVAGGRIAVPVGDANDHSTSGTLYLYRPTA